MAPVEDLPDVLLIHCFSFLGARDLARLETVSRIVQDLVVTSQQALHQNLARDCFWVGPKPASWSWRQYTRHIFDANRPGMLISIGGTQQLGHFALSSVEMIQIPDPELEKKDLRWSFLPKLKQSRDAASAVFSLETSCIVVMGGWSRNKSMDAVSSLNLDTYEWCDLPSLSKARCFLGAACDANGNLYACGGGESLYRGSETYNSVEILRPGGSEWSRAAPMTTKRCGHGVALSRDGKSLFAVGGYGGGMLYHASAERMCLESGRWESISATMSNARTGVAVACGPFGSIYACGGSKNGADMLDTMEMLDPRAPGWLEKPKMPQARGYTSAAFASDGRLWVAGGAPSTGQLNRTVECFDPRANRWDPQPPMKIDRVNHSVVFAFGLVPSPDVETSFPTSSFMPGSDSDEQYMASYLDEGDGSESESGS